MRDIKFRAWDKEKRVWISNGEIEYSISEYTLTVIPNTIEHIGDSVHDYYVSKRFAVMQYTGLKDKNGVEIYEGDIVSLKGLWINVAGLGEKENHQVEWNKETTGWNPFANYDSDCGVYVEADGCEIIGNIYENPELLEANELKENK